MQLIAGWGNGSGPYHSTTNPSASGDAVSDYVDYYPYKNVPSACITEVATIILLSLGLMGLGGFVWFRRRRPVPVAA